LLEVSKNGAIGPRFPFRNRPLILICANVFGLSQTRIQEIARPRLSLLEHPTAAEPPATVRDTRKRRPFLYKLLAFIVGLLLTFAALELLFTVVYLVGDGGYLSVREKLETEGGPRVFARF